MVNCEPFGSGAAGSPRSVLAAPLSLGRLASFSLWFFAAAAASVIGLASVSAPAPALVPRLSLCIGIGIRISISSIRISKIVFSGLAGLSPGQIRNRLAGVVGPSLVLLGLSPNKVFSVFVLEGLGVGLVLGFLVSSWHNNVLLDRVLRDSIAFNLLYCDVFNALPE